jgi:uncharacterized protein with PIN domain
LQEVSARFGLIEHARPFTLCLCCNLALKPVARASVLDRLPAQVALTQDAFYRCAGCERIYWPGSHYVRMRAALGRMLGDTLALPRP